MSSPIGGFYLSALNRSQKEKLERAKDIQINLEIKFEYKDREPYFCNLNTVAGELLKLECNDNQIELETKFLQSGLLNTLFTIKDHGLTYRQEFNLLPNETTSSCVAESNDLKIKILASYNSGLNNTQ